MNCKEVIDLIDAYLDRELDPVTNNNIEAHLRECSALRTGIQGSPRTHQRDRHSRSLS